MRPTCRSTGRLVLAHETRCALLQHSKQSLQLSINCERGCLVFFERFIPFIECEFNSRAREREKARERVMFSVEKQEKKKRIDRENDE